MTDKDISYARDYDHLAAVEFARFDPGGFIDVLIKGPRRSSENDVAGRSDTIV